MNDKFQDDDQAGMLPSGLDKIFGTNPLFTEESIKKSMYYIPQGTNSEGKPLIEFIPKDDWNELQQSQVMYSKEESREFELERENERLLIVIDMQKLEIETLKKQLFGSLPGLNSNLQNNY